MSIGLDKSTKLQAVFQRYVDFCNEHSDDPIYLADVEFVHCQLLLGSDTAETSALMKNDRIRVRAVQAEEREKEENWRKLQRDADRHYFAQMRRLMPDLGKKTESDIILDCQGKLLDESGRNQQVLRTSIRAHPGIISKRCPWLGALIQKARSDNKDQHLVAIEYDETENDRDQLRRIESDGKMAEEEDEDDSIEVLNYSPKDKPEGEESGANEIEIYDEEDQAYIDGPEEGENRRRSESPILSSQQSQSNSERGLLRVTIPHHSPEAMKLLLEFCYTNRVSVLGQDAFTKACKTKPSKHHGPVPPTTPGSRRWMNNGHPLVSFSVALAGIALAEEALMPRLSLMCEVAACQLVASTNVAEALSMCTNQKSISGNDLPLLRKAAMDVILRNGVRGVVELNRNSSFRRALDERRAVIVPTLLQGTTEAVDLYTKRRGFKRERPSVAHLVFDEADTEDSYKREQERRKRRKERGQNLDHPYDEGYDMFEDPLISMLTETASIKRSINRIKSHVDTIHKRRSLRSPSSGLREFFRDSPIRRSRRRTDHHR